MAKQRSRATSSQDHTSTDRTTMDSTTTDGTAVERKKGVTPPKGRPTRARDATGRRQRAFGPVAQWITVGVLVALIVVVLVLITDGGDFNPFDDQDQLPTQFGAPSATSLVV